MVQQIFDAIKTCEVCIENKNKKVGSVGDNDILFVIPHNIEEFKIKYLSNCGSILYENACETVESDTCIIYFYALSKFYSKIVVSTNFAKRIGLEMMDFEKKKWHGKTILAADNPTDLRVLKELE